jgi:hypothetical protein
VQTTFNTESVIGESGNSVGPLRLGFTTKFGYGPSQSKEGKCCSQISTAETIQSYSLAACPSPITILQNSCVDPFFKPPCRLSVQELEAVDHSKWRVKELPKVLDERSKPNIEKFIVALFIRSLQCEVVGCSVELEERSLSFSYCRSLPGTLLLCETMDKMITLCTMQKGLVESYRIRFAIPLQTLQ